MKEPVKGKEILSNSDLIEDKSNPTEVLNHDNTKSFLELTNGASSELTTGASSELTTGASSELTTGFFSELTTGASSELTTGVSSEITTDSTTELSIEFPEAGNNQFNKGQLTNNMSNKQRRKPKKDTKMKTESLETKVTENTREGNRSDSSSNGEEENKHTYSEVKHESFKQSHIDEECGKASKKFKGSRSLKVLCKQVCVTVQERCQKNNKNQVHGRVCEICGDIFLTKKKWDNHWRYKHNKGLKYYKCEICKYSTPYLSTFKRHKEMHEYRTKKKQDVNNEIISPHMCDQCGKCFVSRGSLLTHVRAHTDPQSYQCVVCQKLFSQKGNLKSHLQRHQKQEERKQKVESDSGNARKLQPSAHPCKSCNKVFRWKACLSRHVKTIHYGIKNFICSQCCKKFADISALKKHELNHAGTKPFKCEYCDGCYSSKHNLEQHVLSRHKHQR